MKHLDTHVLLWLYTGEVERLPASVRDAIEADDIAISPMVLLELSYLREIGRVDVDPEAVVADLSARIGLQVSATSFHHVAREALALSWTRDPFDRIIAATAIAEGATLLTADRTILECLSSALWE
jgi:PIN domain nuclease of toxin-antitoxin system